VRTKLAPAAAALLLGAAVLTACGPDQPSETLTVLAAASLTDVFETLADDFESDHSGVEVVFTFAGSPILAHQIVEGAPADVFAAASPETMATVVDAGLAEDPIRFAANRIVVVVPPDNPAGISGYEDLGETGVRIAACAPGVPCGDAAAAFLREADLVIDGASEESDVRSVRAKVEAGEVDAGLVFATDVNDGVLALPTPDYGQTVYEIAAIGDGDLAAAWIDLVTSERGLRALEDAGFARS
jgi:molybdate transport system substrate-binding protein